MNILISLLTISGAFFTLIGLLTVFYWLKPSKEPADSSNRINRISSWWIGLTRPEVLATSYAYFRQDVMENVESVQREKDPIIPSDKWKLCNHHHELTDNHSVVDFGDGEFVANNEAIPLLKALNDLGLRTRTHHIDSNGGFVSILLGGELNVSAEVVENIQERDANREKYKGRDEVLIKWYKEENNS